MLRTVGKTFGAALTVLCLASTLAIAQSQSPSWHYTTPSQIQAQEQQRAQMVAQAHPQSRYMTCMADDGKGNCTAAAAGNGPTEVVNGEGLIMGDRMLCTDLGSVIDCQPAANQAATASNLTCTSDDGNGHCIAGVAADGQVIAVIGEDVQTGDQMTCVTTDNVMHCTLMR